ncbi:MAG: response regulator transcription factor [Deltaproteobacteria bacterium]|nr:response regulator transcription factor [Deltaproteobacteria bacterium]
MIKILIADDHAIVREGLKQILAETSDMVVGGEATNGQEVLEHVRREDWDLVLLDLAMPGKDGLETLKELKLEKPKLPVLVLSIYPEEQYAVRLLKAGAAGYLTKESAPEELIAAIRKVSHRGLKAATKLKNDLITLIKSRCYRQNLREKTRNSDSVAQKGKYISSSLAGKLAFYLGAGAEKPLHEMLSDREYKVILMIASGKTVKEIAYEMFLSIKTVSTYRVRALNKMGMKKNAEFTYYALKHGLVD